MSVKFVIIYFTENDFSEKYGACKHHYIRDNVTFLTSSDPAGWPERKSLATSKVSSFGSTLHHASFRPSHLDSPQEPAKDRVAPLQPIALRRSSQWRNHQNSKREKLETQGTVQNLSQHTQVFSKRKEVF